MSILLFFGLVILSLASATFGKDLKDGVFYGSRQPIDSWSLPQIHNPNNRGPYGVPYGSSHGPQRHHPYEIPEYGEPRERRGRDPHIGSHVRYDSQSYPHSHSNRYIDNEQAYVQQYNRPRMVKGRIDFHGQCSCDCQAYSPSLMQPQPYGPSHGHSYSPYSHGHGPRPYSDAGHENYDFGYDEDSDYTESEHSSYGLPNVPDHRNSRGEQYRDAYEYQVTENNIHEISSNREYDEHPHSPRAYEPLQALQMRGPHSKNLRHDPSRWNSESIHTTDIEDENFSVVQKFSDNIVPGHSRPFSPVIAPITPSLPMNLNDPSDVENSYRRRGMKPQYKIRITTSPDEANYGLNGARPEQLNELPLMAKDVTGGYNLGTMSEMAENVFPNKHGFAGDAEPRFKLTPLPNLNAF